MLRPVGCLRGERFGLTTPYLAPDGLDRSGKTSSAQRWAGSYSHGGSRRFKSLPFTPHERPGQADGWQLGPVDGAGAARSRCAIQSANVPGTRGSSRIADARSHHVQGRPNRWRQRDEPEHPTVPASLEAPARSPSAPRPLDAGDPAWLAGSPHLHRMRAHGSAIGRGGPGFSSRREGIHGTITWRWTSWRASPSGMTARRLFNCRPTAKCRSQGDDGHRLAAYRRWRTNRRPKGGRR